MARLIPLLLLAACLSPAPSPAAPLSWRDAWSEYEGVWCLRAETCNPGLYASRDACVSSELRKTCASEPNVTCLGLYPIERLPVLEQCLGELAETFCDEWLPPNSCFEAMIP